MQQQATSPSSHRSTPPARVPVIGLTGHLSLIHIYPEVAEACLQAVKRFEQLGATVTEATPPWTNLELSLIHI